MCSEYSLGIEAQVAALQNGDSGIGISYRCGLCMWVVVRVPHFIYVDISAGQTG